MIDQNAKKFGVYLITQVVGELDDSTQRKVLARIQAQVPNFEMNQAQSDLTTEAWQSKLAPKIVDHYAQSFDSGQGGYKATA